MKFKQNFNAAFLVFITIISIWGVIWFTKSAYFPQLDNWVQDNFLLYVLCLYFVKVLGIVWPPISGGIFTVASIPFLGWKLAFLIDFLGSISGGAIAYQLGAKYGYALLHKFFGTRIVQKVKNIKIKKGREIEAVLMYKLLIGNVILEAIYYGAGVLKINFAKFIIGSVLGHIIIGIPSFYFTNNIISGHNVIITILLVLVAIFVITKTKGRYFE